ncbi:T9SS type A sorting domain-containing protein [bacterium]|nr:T9SS type A sorting domain-containing protein [bacterium]
MKLFVLLIFFLVRFAAAQDNKLGIWLWHIEGTGFTHEQLADTLSKIGVKRIYVKVADGMANPTIWTELLDTVLVQTYKNKGLEVWAWSYNYTNNYVSQAQSLYLAAQTGYDGYVVDVESEFDGLTTELHSLFQAFFQAKTNAIANGFATNDFKLYCTTWGNPAVHNFHVEIIDLYVDAHMPQTYLEVWGQNFLLSVDYWVNYGTAEYQSFGVQKPVHHIVSDEYNIITAGQINEFIDNSGAETSLWRVPGSGTPLSIWNTISNVNWDKNFVKIAKTKNKPADFTLSQNFPNPFNPATAIVYELSGKETAKILIFNVLGEVVREFLLEEPKGEVVWNGTDFSGKTVSSGIYFYRLETENGLSKTKKMVFLK